MANDDWNHGESFIRDRTPLGAAAVLLGIYVAMYLAVGAAVHFLTPADATAAVAGDGSRDASAVAAAPAAQDGVAPSMTGEH